MKAQTSLVFVFILAVFIIGLITLIAYKGIAEITKKSDEATKAQLINDIKTDMNSLRRMRDSSEIFTYKLPSIIAKICFVKTCSNDCDTVYSSPMPAQIIPYKAQKPQKNLFLMTYEGVSDAVETGAVAIDNTNGKCASENFCCFENQAGQMKVRFTGTGESVKIGKE